MIAFRGLSFLLIIAAIHGAENFHTIQLSSPPSDTCEPFPQAITTPATLPIVNMHGPCSGNAQKTPTVEEILTADKARVDAIHRRKTSVQTDATVLPAIPGVLLLNGGYLVRLGFGTPTQQVSLVFDTGSSLTWTQCLPCTICYEQADPIFDTSKSSSYSNESCTSTACALAALDTSIPTECSSAGTCVYGIAYGDDSLSVGLLADEKLTISKSDAVSGFKFGCSKVTGGRFGVGGTFGLAAGLLGLARGPLSFNTQAAALYNRIFSYCIPSTSRTTGFLSFGGRGTTSAIPLQYTPISSSFDPSFFGVDIVGVSVGGIDLSIPQSVFATAKAVIDSGTRISRLPPAAYAAIRNAFAAEMTSYSSAPPVSLFDTCFDFGTTTSISFPKIAFTFKGGAVVNLNPTAILYSVGSSRFCLGLAPNEKANDVAVFGNVQQRTFEIVHDELGGRIGFAPNVCK